MYDYEIYRSNAAELIRRADAEREVRVARLARKEAARQGRGDAEGQVSPGRDRFVHAA